MSNSTKDTGVITTLLERFEKQRLPRALALKSQVDAGQRLSQADIDFLKLVFQDAKEIQPLVSRYPEYEPLVAQVIHLYHEITEKALANER
jgi:hypothetical protein